MINKKTWEETLSGPFKTDSKVLDLFDLEAPRGCGRLYEEFKIFAHEVSSGIPDSAETTLFLRKMLEARDCLVRAFQLTERSHRYPTTHSLLEYLPVDVQDRLHAFERLLNTVNEVREMREGVEYIRYRIVYYLAVVRPAAPKTNPHHKSRPCREDIEAFGRVIRFLLDEKLVEDADLMSPSWMSLDDDKIAYLWYPALDRDLENAPEKANEMLGAPMFQDEGCLSTVEEWPERFRTEPTASSLWPGSGL